MTKFMTKTYDQNFTFESKKVEWNFLDRKMTPLPPSKNFQEFIHYGEDRPPLCKPK